MKVLLLSSGSNCRRSTDCYIICVCRFTCCADSKETTIEKDDADDNADDDDGTCRQHRVRFYVLNAPMWVALCGDNECLRTDFAGVLKRLAFWSLVSAPPSDCVIDINGFGTRINTHSTVDC